MAEKWRIQLNDRLKGLYTSGMYADLTIICGDDIYRTHKSIVCSGSDFFAGALRFTAGKEAEANKIDLPEDDPVAVKAMLAYLYTADYEPALLPTKESVVRLSDYTYDFPHTCIGSCHERDEAGRCMWQICHHHTCLTDTCGNKCRDFTCDICLGTFLSGDADQLTLHVKVYAIADKYTVHGLKDLSREKFAYICREFWDDEQFAIAARSVYTTIPDHDAGLRKVVCATIANHLTLTHKDYIEELLSEIPGLAKDVLKNMAVG